MANKKKIHCKHGLDRKQEVEARRLRVKLEEGNNEVIAKYNELWRKWFKTPTMSFESFLLKEDVVYYSAYMRACQSKGSMTIYESISLYNS